jgi:predicted small integral membrane protein
MYHNLEWIFLTNFFLEKITVVMVHINNWDMQRPECSTKLGPD